MVQGNECLGALRIRDIIGVIFLFVSFLDAILDFRCVFLPIGFLCRYLIALDADAVCILILKKNRSFRGLNLGCDLHRRGVCSPVVVIIGAIRYLHARIRQGRVYGICNLRILVICFSIVQSFWLSILRVAFSWLYHLRVSLVAVRVSRVEYCRIGFNGIFGKIQNHVRAMAEGLLL